MKPQIGRLPNGVDLSNSAENENFFLQLIAALGVPAANAEMAEFGGRRTLIVERFDRLWTTDKRLLRLPQEDFCQALSVSPARKYQFNGSPGMKEILELLKGSDEPSKDTATFMRAAIVFWLIGATDAHAKNFSLFLNPGGRFNLTPLYDVLSAQPSLDAKQIQPKAFKLAMSVGKSRHYAVNEILPRHFLQTADLAGVGHAVVRNIFNDLGANFETRFREVVKALPASFPKEIAASIEQAAIHRLGLIVQNPT